MKNRIIGHRTVRAGDILPHEMNPRTHSDSQRDALRRLLDEIGFARSLLAYEVDTPAGRRLKLIDGHLRQSLDPEAQVTVEVLDVNDAEARALLLAIDPLAQLAGYDGDTLARLRDAAESQFESVRRLWSSLTAAQQTADKALADAKKAGAGAGAIGEQFLLTVECADERQQVQLLQRFKAEGLKVQAKTI